MSAKTGKGLSKEDYDVETRATHNKDHCVALISQSSVLLGIIVLVLQNAESAKPH